MGQQISLLDVEVVAGHAARSGCYGPTNTQADFDRVKGECVLRVLRGLELGMSAAQALDAWHNMKGKLVLKADLHVGVCLKRPDLCAKFELVTAPEDRERATYRVQRVGGEPREFTFTMGDAKSAGLLSNQTWQKYPSNMLRARCGAIAARAMFPDLLGGLYDEGEGEEIAASGRGGRYRGGSGASAPQLPPASASFASQAAAEVVAGEAQPVGLTPDEARASIAECSTSGALDDLNVKLRAAAASWPPAERLAVREARDARSAKLVAEGK